MTTQVDTQTLEQDSGTDNPERGSEDEAIALFNQRAKSQAQATPETPEDEPQEADEEEPKSEEDDGDPKESETEAENLVEVQYEGKTYSVPPELQKALLRQSDYSRKMNEVGSKEKDYAQRIERADKLIEGAQEYAKALAKVSALDAQLEQFKDVDFEKLETEEPARASLLAVKYMRLQTARDKAAADAQGIDAQIADSRVKNIEAKRADMFKTLEKDLPGWGEELGLKVTKYAVDSGFSREELMQLTDARLVIALDKARKFDAIQQGKAAATERAKAAPQQVARPGAPRRVDKSTEALQSFQKSKSPDDAVKVFMARAAAKQR